MAQGNPFVVLNNATTEFSRNSPHLDEPHASNAERVAGAALALSDTPYPAALPSNQATTRRTVSRRGVVWLGQTCNLHCDFCYFIDRVHTNSHPEHAFMPLEKAKEICRTLVETYGNSAVDIEGGEPTLYPHILELIAYCSQIGLYPTLITNAIVLDDADRCRKMRDAGLRDLKISIHGLGEVHDHVVGRQGAHKRQIKAIRNMRELGIPFRFNTVLTPGVLPQLPDIARLAVSTGALCVNWLGYNPHEDQLGKAKRRNLIPNFTELRTTLTEALDILQAANIETNVRYMPVCMVEPRHRECIYDYQQLFYDHREWDLASWGWTTLPPQRNSAGAASDPVAVTSLALWVRLHRPMRWAASVPYVGPLLSIKRLVSHQATRRLLLQFQRLLTRISGSGFSSNRAALYNEVARLHARFDCRMEFDKSCHSCAARYICSGILCDYHEVFGRGEVQPIPGPAFRDPLHFIRNQKKLVETEDEGWALPVSDGGV
jgi:MoaA/NifB/PqqE/SkfB family radical SAM enzyme